MDNFQIVCFAREIEQQCDFAMMAFEDLRKAKEVYLSAPLVRPASPPRPEWPTDATSEAIRAFFEEQRAYFDACMAALAAANAANAERGLQRSISAYDIWRAIHSMLSHTANVSKVLFRPASRKGAKRLIPNRHADLQTALAIGPMPAIDNRDVRNCFDHFDEELEKVVGASSGRIVADLVIGDKDLIVAVKDGKPVDLPLLRFFNPDTMTVWILGHKFEITAVAEALLAIREATVAAKARHKL